MEDHLVKIIFTVIFFMSIAVFASVFFKVIRFPFTVGLVVIGGIMGFLALNFGWFPWILQIHLTSDVILYLILPTLIFDASINIDAHILLKNIVPILLLAVLGLLISAGIVAGVLGLFTSISIGGALLFGALISATDPVAVIALFNEVGAPKRLVTLVDGESLFNDATAIVLFTVFYSMIELSTGAISNGLGFSGALLSFFIVLIGGLIIGVVLGGIGAVIVRAQKDNLILQITVSLALAYVSFIIADKLKVSGVMSTLSAGIVYTLLIGEIIKGENHHYLESFWSYFSFLANSFIFLMLGIIELKSFDSINAIKDSLLPILWVIPAVTLARLVVIYVLIPLYNKFSRSEEIPFNYQHVLFWGGLRGAVPVALVLTVSSNFCDYNTLIHITLAYVLFTLLFQGTTISWLMNKIGVKPDKSYFDSHEGKSFSFDFKSDKLAELIVSQIIIAFKKEGFIIESNWHVDKIEYLFFKKGQAGVLIELDGTNLKMTTSPGNVNYGTQIVYETLLYLKDSVASLGDIVDPKKMQKLVKSEQGNNVGNFRIGKFLNENLVKVELDSNDKNSVIRELVGMIVSAGIIKSADEAVADIFEREESMSTGIGEELAIPHARSNMVDKITVAIGIKKEGVDFDAIDNRPVKIFFLILSPKSEASPHLQLLSAISKKIMDKNIKSALLSAKTPGDIINILKKR